MQRGRIPKKALSNGDGSQTYQYSLRHSEYNSYYNDKTSSLGRERFCSGSYEERDEETRKKKGCWNTFKMNELRISALKHSEC